MKISMVVQQGATVMVVEMILVCNNDLSQDGSMM